MRPCRKASSKLSKNKGSSIEKPFIIHFSLLTIHYYSTTIGLYFGTRVFMIVQPIR